MRHQTRKNGPGWLSGPAAAAFGAALALSGAGCGTERPPAAGAGAVTGREAAALEGSLAAFADGEQASGGPTRAPHGVRWGDIPLAVARAGDLDGVEMVVVRELREPGLIRFELRTAEDWPAEFAVRRLGPPAVYEVLDCRVGLFPDTPGRAERCERFVREFRRQLEILGAQRWFNEPDG